MTPWLDDGDVRLYAGDALDQLALMPSESVQCIVTSPPFWGLRDYSCEGQIGLEETPDEWCARLVAVMREARRVLRNDGVCFIEIGDTYAASSTSDRRMFQPTRDTDRSGGVSTNREPAMENGRRTALGDVKPKDLVGAPWLLAFALRADGWYLRSDTIWARPNPMPESVTDRPTKAHSYVFLLTKSARYFMDMDAIREDVSPNWSPSNAPTVGEHGEHVLKEGHSVQRRLKYDTPKGANARSVWSIATEPTPFAHFATFPQALVERCIKAGTSEHGACGECGAPWRRTIEKGEPELRAWSAKGAGHVNQSGSREEGSTLKHAVPRETTGWEPSCAHDAPVTPCLVLDPFMGSGTTALVARRLGRHAIGIELNLSYLEIAATRLQQLSLLGGHA